MTRRPIRQPLAAIPQGQPMQKASCSVFVLASLGLLATTASAGPQAPALPANAVPVLRGVVSGQAVVNAPTATAQGRLLTIDQQSQRAIIDWLSFNIGSGSEVRFNQPGPTASALNRIYGLDPSVIQGKLTANGQVLLINQNGILFDRGAQINVQSLVASTLNISNARFNSGSLASGGLGAPAFEGGYDEAGNTLAARPDGSRPGAIALGAGGAGAAPTLTSAAGGAILLFAPRIDNRGGVITSPDGQIILAAGGKVYLALPEGDNNTLRGFQVEIEAPPNEEINLTSLIRNGGALEAARGNVTLAALAINQEGRVSASSAIQANGSIYLKARSKDGAQAGTVTLAAGSSTEVLPDRNDKSTMPESQNYASPTDDRRGMIAAEGRTIESAGALVAAGGVINLTAADAADPGGARVYLDKGSVTSVAGNWADVAYADNLLTFKVTSNELKDAPDQKSGVLKGATVTVDLRKSTPALDLSGYQAAQGRNVGQKAAAGGALSITSTGSLIQRDSATLDASGGGFVYGAGTSATSKLLGADGRIYDISTAPKDRSYTSLLDRFEKTYPRWGLGVTEVYSGLLYGVGQQEAGYVEGKVGGSIYLQSAAGLVLDGVLRGGVTVGPNQLANAPRGAALAIGTFSAVENDFVAEQRIGNVTVVQSSRDSLGPAFTSTSALTPVQQDNVTLAARQVYGAAPVPNRGVYEQTAFDSVALNVNGRVRIDDGVQMTGAPGSSLSVRAPQIDVAGRVDMPAGSIALRPVDTVHPISPDLDSASAGVSVRSGGGLSTAGVWINNAGPDGSFVGTALPSARQNLLPDGTTSTSSMLNGGSVTIGATAVSATQLERGSSLDIGGGGALDRNRRITAGSGGSLSIANGLPANPSPDWMQASIEGFALGNGGRLAVTTPRLQIEADGANGTLPGNTTRLVSSFFTDHGLSSVTLNATQGIEVAAGTALTLQQKNRVLDPVAAAAQPTGADLRAVAPVQCLPDDVRQPMNLTLATAGAGPIQGSAVLKVGEGASISADPKAKLTFNAVDGLEVAGRITAPGGDVALRLIAPVGVTTPDLRLAPSAQVSVAGTFVARPNVNGLVQGSVVDAGSITIEAQNTGVQLKAGSALELDGVAQVVQALDGGGSAVTSRTVYGNAGALVVKSQGGVALDGQTSAHGKAAAAAGGTFALELNAPDNQDQLPDARRIVVSQGPATAASVTPGVLEAAIAIDPLREAGFDKLRLQAENTIEFRGDVRARFARGVRLDAPQIDVTNDARVNVVSANVALGQSLAPRSDAAPFARIDRGAAPARPTRPGGGVLSVQAGTIDVFGSTVIDGVTETRLFSDGDIRFTGRNVLLPAQAGETQRGGQVGGLTTAGDLTLSAAQLYPSTRTDFSIAVAAQTGGGALVPGGTVTVTSNGKIAGDVYSAGGRLAIDADHIVQAGVIKAPQGQLSLNAGSSLELAAGSTTSVSGAGVIVPYGSTQAGLSWQYQDGPGSPNPLSTPSGDGKRLVMTGRRVDVRPGATVDVSGGGDVVAIEWVPGSGGSTDTLQKDNTYAVIPKSSLSSMPVDTDLASRKDIGFGLQTASPDTSVYDSLVIGIGSPLPAGEYVLLPGRYALLPGAYLVRLQAGGAFANMAPGQIIALANGQVAVAGQRSLSGTDVRASQTVGVLVRPGSDARRESDYTVTGSSYFADQASRDRAAVPRLPVDAGRVQIVNANTLSLGGQFNTEAGNTVTATSTTPGRSAEIDISAPRLAVVDQVTTGAFDADVLQVEGKRLSALGGSVLLGGTRADTAKGVQLTTQASDVVVANSAAGALKTAEVMLTASGLIEVREGAVLSGNGAARATTATQIAADAGGALVRLSNGEQATVDRGAVPNTSTGEIRIAQGASVGADRSVLLDATANTRTQAPLIVGTTAAAGGGSLSLASLRISLGDTQGVPGADQGLVIGSADLGRYKALDALSLKGYGGIDLYGAAVIGGAGLGQLTIDSPAVRGHATTNSSGSTARIVARDVTFVATQPPTLTGSSGTGAPALSIEATRLTLGAGDKSIGGFSAVALTASEGMVAAGNGTLNVQSNLSVQTPVVDVAGGAVQRWTAADVAASAAPAHFDLALTNPSGAAVPSADAGLGGRLSLEGRRIDVAGTIRAPSGKLSLTATGTSAQSGVNLAAGARLDAAGRAQDFRGTIATADGGLVRLEAGAGDVRVSAGATIDVGAAAQGGDAGALTVRGRSLDLQGDLKAAAGSNARGGSVAVDVDQLADFSALNRRFNQAGATGSRDLRLRSGDLTVSAGDAVVARRIQLSADAGSVALDGALDASAPTGGGRIDVWAANGLSLGTGARLSVAGTSTAADVAAPMADGGSVQLATAGGALTMSAGASIDVRPGAKGDAGRVAFVVDRNAANVMNPISLNGEVLSGTRGPAKVTVEARRVHDNAAGTLAAGAIDDYAAQHAAFMNAAPTGASLGNLRSDGGVPQAVRVRGATEVRSAGDLSLSSPWDLTASAWNAGNQPGTLTLRAAGTLTVSSAVGLPSDSLPATDSWSLRLVGGADLAAANPLATRPVDPTGASGHVLLEGDAARVRVGTGAIDIAAATDFRMSGLQSVVYTSGRIGAADTATGGNDRWSRDGGDISITAGRDAIGSSDLWVNEWLRRPRTTPAVATAADWWVYRPNFQQGIGTLGGGDIRISAGRDVDRLSANAPTTGRTFVDADGVSRVDVQGGGDLAIGAGNDIRGGVYLVGRGQATLQAGGQIGADARTQIHMMGASSGDVPEQATVNLTAGSGVALQSVNNPTAVYMTNGTGTGPSFGAGGTRVSTFFSYSDNSTLNVAAKSGDVQFGGAMLDSRTISPSQAVGVGRVEVNSSAYPANLTAAAFAGNVSGDTVRSLVTYPSSTAHVTLLAGGSVQDINIAPSDRSPSLVVGVGQPERPETRQFTGEDLTAKPGEARIVSREPGRPYAFEIQALAGDVQASGANAIVLNFPSASRIVAGNDIKKVGLTLQNLRDGDVSEVRAENGDVLPASLEIGGPGRLVVQAGRNVDLGAANVQRSGAQLGGLIATGNTTNASLFDERSARITVIAGVKVPVDLARLDASYESIIALNGQSDAILAFYRQLNGDPNRDALLVAKGIDELVARDNTYAPFVALAKQFPVVLKAYQDVLRRQSLPLGNGAEALQAAQLYALLNRETDIAAIVNARSVAELRNGTLGGAAYDAFVAFDQKYPRAFADYRQRRSKGALPEGLTPIVFSDVLASVVNDVVPAQALGRGDINSYLTSVQTYGGSDIDLWAPGGRIVAGLTTPSSDRPVGIVTNAGGAIRGVVADDFNINQGKVLTAQGGDIALYSAAGSIDAGRGARTSLSTPPPKRTPIVDPQTGAIVGFVVTLPASASGSGIQTLTSDPDGLGPRIAPLAGSIFLFAPGGTIDAGEAGIRSGGNIVINAQSVLNATNIASSGSSVGVPQVQTGSAAASVATSGANTTGVASKAAEEAGASASNAARAAAAATAAKANILSVEVLGFGDKNCKEGDKDCFAK